MEFCPTLSGYVSIPRVRFEPLRDSVSSLWETHQTQLQHVLRLHPSRASTNKHANVMRKVCRLVFMEISTDIPF